MTFTTFTFVVFLAVVFALYWLIRDRTGQNLLIVLSSYFFYGWWDWRFMGLMLAASLVDYATGLGLEATRRPLYRRLLLAVSLCTSLGLLGFFKYFNFFAENLQAAAAALGWELSPVTLRLVLPVGISFYTFQTMSYALDIYRGRMRATRNLIDYLAFVSFFPQLVAGPIERATALLPQFTAERRFDYAAAVDGCRQMLWGFFKKLVVADNLAPLVERYYGNVAGSSGLELAFATFCFAFQIYCDFSAYSDIAVGTAKLFGIQLMRNFAYPYFSQSVAEFWRRWHISLSTWFRDYLYIPLGGSRGSWLRKTFNVMVTFMVSGLWHGASWNFVIWGTLHGLGTLPAVLTGGKERRGPNDTPGGEALVLGPVTVLRIVATFVFVYLTWVFFRAATFDDAVTVLTKFVSPGIWTWSSGEYVAILDANADSRWTLFWLAVLVAAEWVQRRHTHPLTVGSWPRPLRWVLYTVLVGVILFFGTKNQGQFIYFQF